MFIQNHYNEELTAGSISSYVHYNEYYFMRVFKKYTGRTIVAFITEYRLEKAKELLQSNELTIEEVRTGLAFLQQVYFSGKFK